MPQYIAQFTLVVDDYDEAIEYYQHKLGFLLLEDTILNESKRWVVMAPSTEKGCTILLAKAKNETQKKAIGNQTGGRVFIFLRTDDFDRDHERFLQNGVAFIEAPRKEVYGKVAVFKDLYGNLWDLVEHANS